MLRYLLLILAATFPLIASSSEAGNGVKGEDQGFALESAISLAFSWIEKHPASIQDGDL